MARLGARRVSILWSRGGICVYLIANLGPSRPAPVHANTVGLGCECAVMRVPLALFRLQSTSGSGGNTTSSPAADATAAAAALAPARELEAELGEWEARVATEEPGVASEVDAARAAEAARKAAAEAEAARMAEVARKAEVEAEVAQRVVSFAMGDHPPGWKETGLRCRPVFVFPHPTSTVLHSVVGRSSTLFHACPPSPLVADRPTIAAPGCGAARPGAAARPQDPVWAGVRSGRVPCPGPAGDL